MRSWKTHSLPRPKSSACREPEQAKRRGLRPRQPCAGRGDLVPGTGRDQDGNPVLEFVRWVVVAARVLERRRRKGGSGLG